MNHYNLLIDGKMVPGDLTMPVINPATEQVITECSRASKEQLDKAIAAAKAAYPAWTATPLKERGKIVSKIADVLEAHAEELANILTSEQGKPFSDSIGEVYGSAAFTRYFSSLDIPVRVIENSNIRRVEVYRRSLGVVGAIVPWNFPLVLLFLKLPAALMAGNTLVI